VVQNWAEGRISVKVMIPIWFQESRKFLDQMCEYQLQVSTLSVWGGGGVGRDGGNRLNSQRGVRLRLKRDGTR
jgi:hypothetical protein